MRRVVVDVQPLEPSERERAWWQLGSPGTFQAKVAGMSTGDLEIVAGEISGALAVIQTQIETRTDDDEWRKRAKQSLGFIAQRKSAVRAELTRRNQTLQSTKVKRRTAAIEEARALLSCGDVAGALGAVLDLLDGSHAKEERVGEDLPVKQTLDEEEGGSHESRRCR